MDHMSKKINFNGKIQPEHRVVYSFTCNDIDFFKFDDSSSIPCGRAFHALSYYEELEMRCTREYLQGAFTAIENILRKTEIDIFEVMKIVQNSKERLDYIFEPEIIKKLASVVYFDESENPYSYDFKYGTEKMTMWDEHPLVIKGTNETSAPGIDFFLSKPIKSLMPSIDLSKKDLNLYLKTMEVMTSEQLTTIISHLSVNDKSKDFYNILKSQIITT